MIYMHALLRSIFKHTSLGGAGGGGLGKEKEAAGGERRWRGGLRKGEERDGRQTQRWKDKSEGEVCKLLKEMYDVRKKEDKMKEER